MACRFSHSGVRASPRVPHPKLLFLFFLAKIEKIFSNNSPFQVAIYAKFGKKASALVFAAHPSVSEEVEGLKNNFVSVSGFLM